MHKQIVCCYLYEFVQSHSFATALTTEEAGFEEKEEYFSIDPQTLVEDEAPSRLSEMHW